MKWRLMLLVKLFKDFFFLTKSCLLRVYLQNAHTGTGHGGCMPLIPALQKKRHKYWDIKAILTYMRSCLTTKMTTIKIHIVIVHFLPV